MSWPIFFYGWGVCFLVGLIASLLLWRIQGAPPSTFTLGSFVSAMIGLLYGLPSLTLVLRSALGWHPIACFVGAVVPGWALALVLAFLVDGFLLLTEAAAEKISHKRHSNS